MTRWGMLDLLAQDEVWQTRDGRLVPLGSLTAEHRAALLNWLGRHAPRLQMEEQMQFLVMPMPGLDTVAYDMVMSDMSSHLSTTPIEWLEEQALVRRLRELDEVAS